MQIPNQLSKEQLIALIKEGDIKAFDSFYKQNWRPLYQMAYHSTGSVDDAKDLVQNVFINFWNYRASLNPQLYHTSFLFTSLKNGIINYYKKDEVRRRGVAELLHFDNQPTYTNEDHYVAKELAGQIKSHINQLPQKMQQIFVLSRQNHLSVNEISEALNITPRTVKNQLSNALRILRTRMGLLSALILFLLK
jgi:RNA polymerase sigma-70 factor (ECF subfamily)